MNTESSLSRFNPRRLAGSGLLLGVGLIAGVWAIGSMVENVGAGEIVVIQSIGGDLDVYTDPGPKWQGFGKVTTYDLRSQYDFDSKIRFNDGAHAVMKGSIQYELPLDHRKIRELHRRYGSQEAVQASLVKTVVDKSIYMSGPLMSSKESYAEKRNSLIEYIEDQVGHGVYRTTQREVTAADALSGASKTTIVVEIVKGPNGQYLRSENSVLAPFGMTTSNLSIASLDYDEVVEKQIQSQQTAAAAVQTAIANARKAEQDAVTATKNGEAMVATARAREEAVKAAAVTVAERGRDVARLESEAAGFTRTRDILLGEGEAQKRRLIMQADGALGQKLDAWRYVNEKYAFAISSYQGAWVPSIVMGGNSAGQINGGSALIDLLMTKTARDLSLDMSSPGGAQVKRTAPPAKQGR